MVRLKLSRFLAVLLFISPATLFASEGAWEVSLRDKAKTPQQKENGATVLYTDPSEGDASYQIDAAINLSNNSRSLNEMFSNLFSIEVHKNTQLEKETDTQLLSYKYGYQTGARLDSGQLWNNLSFGAAWKTDNEKDTESVIASAMWVPFFNNSNKKSWLNIGKDIFIGSWNAHEPQPARWFWEPKFGLLYENQYKSGSDAVDEGNVIRANIGLNITINFMRDREIPKKESKDKVQYVERLILEASYNYYHDLEKDEEAFSEDDEHGLLNVRLSYPLDYEGNIRIYASHTNGEDPVKGMEEQEFNQVGIELKLDL